MQEIEAISVREVTIHYDVLDNVPQGQRLANSADIYRTFRRAMICERVEVFKTILLDSQNRVMAIETVSRGTINQSVVHPREVYSTPVRLQAAAVIFMHNHPSGDPAPSREDRDCTNRLIQAGNILGIRVLDHIIFGFDDYYSFADAGVIVEYEGKPIIQ